VSSLRIEIDWAAVTAGMTPFSIGQVTRQKMEYAIGYASWAWTIEVNWPKGAITFYSPGFTQRLSGSEIETDDQCLTLEQRSGS
jgi:hypothetical protein